MPTRGTALHFHGHGSCLDKLGGSHSCLGAFMKIKAVLSIFLAGLMCSTASAENDWVQRFLERYQPFQAPAPAPAPPSQIPATNSITQGSLAAMVQNGAISLTTED